MELDGQFEVYTATTDDSSVGSKTGITTAARTDQLHMKIMPSYSTYNLQHSEVGDTDKFLVINTGRVKFNTELLIK